MEQKTKEAIVHDMMRKFVEGGKDITSDAFREFIKAQNDGFEPVGDRRENP